MGLNVTPLTGPAYINGALSCSMPLGLRCAAVGLVIFADQPFPLRSVSSSSTIWANPNFEGTDLSRVAALAQRIVHSPGGGVAHIRQYVGVGVEG